MSAPLPTDQHARDELRRLAERASIGRWFRPERVEPDEFYGEYFELPATPKIYTDGAGLFASDAVGAFIAACDPQTVAALLARLDELESLLRETTDCLIEHACKLPLSKRDHGPLLFRVTDALGDYVPLAGERRGE